jgi:hypothetical protein
MSDLQLAKQKLESRREKAAQFAKQVPVPKPKAESSMVVIKESRRKSYGDESLTAVRRSHAPAHNVGISDYGGDENMMDCFDEGTYGITDNFGGAHAAEPSKLELLQAKHAQSKRQVDAIKASIGMK